MGRFSSRRRRPPPTPIPPTPKRPVKRKQWTNDKMKAAMDLIESGAAISINQAAKNHSVPPSTLKDRLSGRVLHGTNPGPKPYLSSTEEKELESYLVESAKLGYGQTRSQVKEVAEKIAKDRGTLHSSRVGDGWWRRFRERHLDLSLRAGDSTAHVRMDAMNQKNLNTYFSLLKKVLEREKELLVQEREKKKLERERKKKEKEELAQKKREEREKRLKENEQKKRASKARRKRKSTSAGGEASVVPSSASSQPANTPSTSEGGRASVVQSESTVNIADKENELTNECAFCFDEYCNDGKDWIECACGAWIHEEYMEDLIMDPTGRERFFPMCLNQYSVM